MSKEASVMPQSLQPSQATQPRIIAGIPAHNEARFVGEVVRRARKYVDQVVVIDDGSTDETSRVAEAAGALVINHGVNKGYGESIKSCFEVMKLNTADVLVVLDADGQHDPDEIPLLIAPILNGEADLVIGSRFLRGQDNMPRYRKFGIKVITLLYNLGSKVKVSDTQSGFRAYNHNILKDFSFTEKGMSLCTETLVEARRKGFVIKEVPILCTYNSGSHSLNPVIHGLGLALKVVQLRLKRR